MSDKVDLYDEFASYYDKMVSWQPRFEAEAAFFRETFEKYRVKTIVDMACGTGMHAILFARWGYRVVGVDLSEEMLRVAADNVKKAGVHVDFRKAGFGELQKSGFGQFDAIVCLGNSLPHILTEKDMAQALVDLRATLGSGGVFITQNRNYDLVWSKRDRFMRLDSAVSDDKELVFFRFLDFHADRITFNIVTLEKRGGEWSYKVTSTQHRPLFRDDVERMLLDAGFQDLGFYGDYARHGFDKEESGDLIVVARKSGRG